MAYLGSTQREKLVRLISDFTSTVGISLPRDVEGRLTELSEQETVPSAKTMYGCMLRNLALAKELKRPLCQDTGMLQYFVEAGTRFPWLDETGDVIREAARMATERTPLRPNAVEPLGEHNTGDNTGHGSPYIEYTLAPGSEDLRIRLYMAGGGSSLPGRSRVLMPLEGMEGVKRFVCDTVVEWGVNACPPLIVGIGLGTCAVTSAELSKKALLRPLGTHCPYPEGEKLEKELTDMLNSIGIAPLGFGGSFSVLGVHVECAAHHPATLGVGISTGCWATRRGELLVRGDLTAELLTHDRWFKKSGGSTGD